MIIDTSVVVAVLTSEAEAADLFAVMLAADTCLMSAGTAVEPGVVCFHRRPAIPEHRIRSLRAEAGISIVPVDEVQARLAWQAVASFGRGRHPAWMNFGDCFAYALAKRTGRPLLFKGADFARTDVAVASW